LIVIQTVSFPIEVLGYGSGVSEVNELIGAVSKDLQRYAAI
jgi:hypothetical protein